MNEAVDASSHEAVDALPVCRGQRIPDGLPRVTGDDANQASAAVLSDEIDSPAAPVCLSITTHGSSSIERAPSMKRRKYHPGNLIPMFRLASKLCKQMRAAGFTDKGVAGVKT
jgi:hypothetical protein